MLFEWIRGQRSRLAWLAFAVAIAYAAQRALRGYFLDLAVYRMGGQAIFDSDALYTLGLPGSGLPFTYSPFSAVLFAPFAALSQEAAQVVWAALMMAALFVLVRESLRAASPKTARRWGLAGVALVTAGTLLFEPILSNLKLGQINIFLCLAIFLDVQRRTGRIPGGVLLGIAAAVKITPMIFVVYYVAVGRYREARNAILAFVGCLAIGAAVRPSDSWQFWTEIAFDASRVGGVAYVANQSILGVLSRLTHGSENSELVSQVLGVGVIAIGLVLAARAHRHGRPQLAFLTCALSALLISPISWSHHWVWVVPAVIWLAIGDDAPQWGRRAAVFGSTILALGPIWWAPKSDDRELAHHGWQLLAANSFFLLCIGLLAALAVHQLRAKKTPALVSAGT